ncbi:hypothetical protein BpHYR1_017308 [Brachionus plicatilis]|uniref:Uncharacterized protein n=1 Tax=Brachionus plicatilis TaxID=10195 RepID=A0A3M7R4I7_BRAPC|nr:hypothetical protein BpHYR1_017308 [Brachionus plicatilis]
MASQKLPCLFKWYNLNGDIENPVANLTIVATAAKPVAGEEVNNEDFYWLDNQYLNLNLDDSEYKLYESDFEPKYFLKAQVKKCPHCRKWMFAMTSWLPCRWRYELTNNSQRQPRIETRIVWLHSHPWWARTHRSVESLFSILAARITEEP